MMSIYLFYDLEILILYYAFVFYKFPSQKILLQEFAPVLAISRLQFILFLDTETRYQNQHSGYVYLVSMLCLDLKRLQS